MKTKYKFKVVDLPYVDKNNTIIKKQERIFENIDTLIEAIKSFGVNETDCFFYGDYYMEVPFEYDDISEVINYIYNYVKVVSELES
jgi:hypothetical protein